MVRRLRLKQLILFVIILSSSLPLVKASNTFTDNFENEDYILNYSSTLLNATGENIYLDVTLDNSTYNTPFDDSECKINYTFEENDGATVIDSMNLNNGTATGGSYIDYFFGKAFYFDGNAEYIEVSDASGDLDNHMFQTIEYWVNVVNDSAPSEQWLYRKRDVYGLRLKSEYFNYWVVDGDNGASTMNPYHINIENWKKWHVAQVYNGNLGIMRYYLNGTLLTEDLTSNSGELSNESYQLFIGAYWDSFYYCNMTIDNFRYYQRALNLDELQENYEPRAENGNVTSKNLLADLNSYQINNLTFNVSLPNTTQIEVMFSENGFDWYDRNGNLNLWSTLSDGVNVLNVTDLGFSSNIQYKAKLIKGDALPTTPKLLSVSLEYETGMFNNLFENMFYSQEIWGYIGVLGLLVAGVIVCTKYKYASIGFFPVFVIMAIDYLGLITANGYYAFHFLIMLFGALGVPVVAWLSNKK